MTPDWSWRDARAAWNRFFFAPTDTLPCDIIRIGYAVLVLLNCAFSWPYVTMWYGESGILPWELARDLSAAPGWTLFQWLPKTDTTAVVGLALLTIHALLLLVGAWSRLQAVAVYVWLLSLQNRNQMLLDSEDSVLKIIGFLVMFMPIGHALAWDSWRRNGRWFGGPPTLRPCWALRLLQIEMCVIYLGCAYTKASGEFWLDGRAMFYDSRLDDMFGRFPTPSVLWESMTLLRWMGWLVIAIEALVPVLVWFRETRAWAIAIAVAFHFVMDYTMNLNLFHWIMIVGWLSFVPAEAWRRWLRRTGRERVPGGEPVVAAG